VSCAAGAIDGSRVPHRTATGRGAVATPDT
jgi:hypothetical protein